jgi:transcriptional regulator with XRE-family HTH domain
MHPDPFETKIKAAFGTAAKRRRKELGLSQEALSVKAGLHRTYIADIERGARNLSLVNIFKLANALSIPVADLCSAMEVFYKQVAASM